MTLSTVKFFFRRVGSVQKIIIHERANDGLKRIFRTPVERLKIPFWKVDYRKNKGLSYIRPHIRRLTAVCHPSPPLVKRNDPSSESSHNQ